MNSAWEIAGRDLHPLPEAHLSKRAKDKPNQKRELESHVLLHSQVRKPRSCTANCRSLPPAFLLGGNSILLLELSDRVSFTQYDSSPSNHTGHPLVPQSSRITQIFVTQRGGGWGSKLSGDNLPQFFPPPVPSKRQGCNCPQGLGDQNASAAVLFFFRRTSKLSVVRGSSESLSLLSQFSYSHQEVFSSPAASPPASPSS